MAQSAPCLKEVIKPEKLVDYQRGLTRFCDNQYNPLSDHWLPRECCQKPFKYDKGVPGLCK